MGKCDSCCAIATWNCFSNHYCERCHNEASSAKHYPCPGPASCPLGIPHPPNSEAIHCQSSAASFVIGCRACLGSLDVEELSFDEKNQFGFPKRDWLSLADAGAVLAEVDEQELRSRFAARRLGPEGLGLDVISRLVLAHEQEEQRQEELQEELRRKEEERRRIAEEAYWAAEREMELRWEAEERKLQAEIVEELKVPFPHEECLALKSAREQKRLLCYLRSSRRARLTSKTEQRDVSRARQSPQSHRSHRRIGSCAGRIGQQFPRGGRHKLPKVQWLDLECDGFAF